MTSRSVLRLFTWVLIDLMLWTWLFNLATAIVPVWHSILWWCFYMAPSVALIFVVDRLNDKFFPATKVQLND